VVSRVLVRKLRRDVWRQRWQFAAVVVVIAIGVAVYVAAADSYRNLGQSFDRAYAEQRLPDVVLSGPAAVELGDLAAALPGDPVTAVRVQGDVGIRIRGHKLLGRAVGVPEGQQPEVARLALHAGELPRAGTVVVEQHLADHYGLRPGDTVELMGPGGWRATPVTGAALSTEYFWPARSRQELMTSPEQFGVVFVPEGDIESALAEPVHQIAVYARDRTEVDALVAAARTVARERGLTVTTREDQPSFTALDQDVRSVGDFATLLPWLFLAAVVLGTYVLLSRMVAAQRAVIGTLVANGLSPGTLRRHYIGYGLSAGVLGALPGLVGGYFLGGWFTSRYTEALGLPLHVVSLHADTMLIGATAGIVIAALAAWLPARTAARMSPAEAMRIAPQTGAGGVSVLERLVPVAHRLSARWRMAIRGVTRNPRRTVFTLIGVAVSVSLVMVFAGMRDTVSKVMDRQFEQIQREDGEIVASPADVETVLRAVRADPGVAAAEPVGRHDVTVSAGDRRYETMMIAMPQATTMHDFGTALPADGVLLGKNAQKTYSLSVGDSISLTTAAGQRFSQRIVGFVDEPINALVYVSLEHLNQISGSPTATGALVRLRADADAAAVSRRLATVDGVVAYLSKDSVASMMREGFALYDTLVGLMLAFAAMMAAALLFNAMSANVSERLTELGTLRAAGMGTGTLGRLVAVENLVLVAAAVPLGLGVGMWLADWFLSTFETQGYHWNLELRATTVLLVAAGVVTAALLAQWPVVLGIRRLDIARIVRERSL
jgi:putative ABC transport system permease protein